MDIISNNPKFKKKILLYWSTALLLLHVIFTMLSMYDAYISADIMKKGMDTALSWIIPIVALLLVYLRYGVLVSVYHSYEEGTLPFTAIGIISLVITRACELIIYRFTYSDMSDNIGYYLSSVGTSFMIDLAIVLLLLLFSRNKKERDRKATRLILIACLFPLVISLTEEIWFTTALLIEIKAEYGSVALNSSEITSIILGFVRPVINAVTGFVIMLFTHKTLKKDAPRT